MQPDFQWVDAQLVALAGVLRPDVAERPFLFEPTAEFYGLFSSGEDEDLRRAVALAALHPPVAAHIRGQVPNACYLPPGAGQRGIGGKLVPGTFWGSEIQVPFASMGRPERIGAIIAHELGHLVLNTVGSRLPDYEENECLVDVTGVFVGLGGLLLNGKQSDPTSSLYQENLGHLPLELTGYAFDKACRTRGVDPEAASDDLAPFVQAALESWRCRWPA